MSLPESERLRVRLDALRWRLQEAQDDLARREQEVADLASGVDDERLAQLLGEEGPSPAGQELANIHLHLEREQELVRHLEVEHLTMRRNYRRALKTELEARLLSQSTSETSASPEAAPAEADARGTRGSEA